LKIITFSAQLIYVKSCVRGINFGVCTLKNFNSASLHEHNRGKTVSREGFAVIQASARAERNRASIPAGSAGDPVVKRREILTFLILAFVIWPFLAVAVVGGFGFLIWMYQMIAGPPGPPPV